MNNDSLIQEMLALKQEYPSLTNDEVLKIFIIKSLRELTITLKNR